MLKIIEFVENNQSIIDIILPIITAILAYSFAKKTSLLQSRLELQKSKIDDFKEIVLELYNAKLEDIQYLLIKLRLLLDNDFNYSLINKDKNKTRLIL